MTKTRALKEEPVTVPKGGGGRGHLAGPWGGGGKSRSTGGGHRGGARPRGTVVVFTGGTGKAR